MEEELRIKNILERADERFESSKKVEIFRKNYTKAIEAYQERYFGIFLTGLCKKELEDFIPLNNIDKLEKNDSFNQRIYNESLNNLNICLDQYDYKTTLIERFKENIGKVRNSSEYSYDYKICLLKCYSELQHNTDSELEDCFYKCYDPLFKGYDDYLNQFIEDCGVNLINLKNEGLKNNSI